MKVICLIFVCLRNRHKKCSLFCMLSNSHRFYVLHYDFVVGIKVRGLTTTTLLKRDCSTGFFLWSLQTLKERLFCKTPPNDCLWIHYDHQRLFGFWNVCSKQRQQLHGKVMLQRLCKAFLNSHKWDQYYGEYGCTWEYVNEQLSLSGSCSRDSSFYSLNFISSK